MQVAGPQGTGQTSLFDGLDAGELAYVLRIARRHEFERGALLVRQGQPADSALILEQGRAQVMTVLPGGGEMVVAELGPGSVLGETALLEIGVRSANVVAAERIACCSIERDAFRMLIAQRNSAALAINHRIALALCARLRDLNAKIIASSEPAHLAHACAASGVRQRLECTFDWRTFLPVLSVFRHFRSEDIDELASVSCVFDVPRGATLFEAGEPGAACYIVIRGALEIIRNDDGAGKRIGILGPGRLCGILALIENARHSMSAAAREHTTLMEISSGEFMRFYSGDARASLKFQQAIHQELLQALARTNNHLTRLISQARIRNHSSAHELQRVLCEQDCRTAR
jgi:CRP-like cAMP-binding protein